MSTKKGLKNIVCAVAENGSVGIRTDYNGLRYVRFTKLQHGNIAVCIDNQTPITKVSNEQFLNMARNLEGHIIGMHS